MSRREKEGDRMAFVEMKDVYKRYRTGEIVTAASDGINFTIEKGESPLLWGPPAPVKPRC